MTAGPCQMIEATPLRASHDRRITSWWLHCPTCGLDMKGRTLADVLDTEHAHNIENVPQDPRPVTTPAWLTNAATKLAEAMNTEPTTNQERTNP